jgi:SAM-dependent methyltransferase
MLIIFLSLALMASMMKIHSQMRERDAMSRLSDSEIAALLASMESKRGLRQGAPKVSVVESGTGSGPNPLAPLPPVEDGEEDSRGGAKSAKAKDAKKRAVGAAKTARAKGGKSKARPPKGAEKAEKVEAEVVEAPPPKKEAPPPAPQYFATPADEAGRTGGGKAVPGFKGPVKRPVMTASEDFPLIKLSEEEKPWFKTELTNVRKTADKLPADCSPLSSLPYPPGMPSMAAYAFALRSKTFKEMERFSNAFLTVNKEQVDQYQWSRDPLHSWSRKYEYVWHAEVIRAMLPEAHLESLEGTWPAKPAKEKLDFEVLDAGSGFTFYDQFVGSRLGVRVVALDQEDSYIPFFGGIKNKLIKGEADVPSIPYVKAKIETTGLPAASFDAITCVSVLEHVHAADLQLTVKEFKRVLKRGGRLLFTFDTGQPPIAKNIDQSTELLEALRTEMVEDTTHGAPKELLAKDGKLAQQLFNNRKATPPEFGETVFTISGRELSFQRSASGLVGVVLSAPALSHPLPPCRRLH